MSHVARRVGAGDVGADPAKAAVGPVLIRWSGLCLIVAGALNAGAVAHPNIFDTTLAHAALDTPFWREGHALWLAGTVLSLFGLAGLCARQGNRLGVLGVVGLGLAVPGLVLTACIAYAEAFIMPVVAATDPSLLGWNGPLLTAGTIRVSAGLAVLYPLGFLLVGIATRRAGILPRGAATALAVGAPAVVVFAGPFVPVLGVASVVLFAAAHVWLGFALWSGRTGVRTPILEPITSDFLR